MKVNLQSKKTEIQWKKSIDEFWKAFTPLWFDWLQWILILGVISFLADQTGNIVLLVISAFSHAAFFFYLQSLFFSFEFKGFPIIKSIARTTNSIGYFLIYSFISNLVSTFYLDRTKLR